MYYMGGKTRRIWAVLARFLFPWHCLLTFGDTAGKPRNDEAMASRSDSLNVVFRQTSASFKGRFAAFCIFGHSDMSQSRAVCERLHGVIGV